MKLHYYPETDSLYLELKTREVVDGLSLRWQKDGNRSRSSR